jgi:hypothetical protein
MNDACSRHFSHSIIRSSTLCIAEARVLVFRLRFTVTDDDIAIVSVA